MRSCLNYEGRPYYLPSYVDMTDDDVREACLTGPQALYGHHYNLFCHLCRYGRYNAADQCKGKDLGGRDSSAGSIFVLLGSSISKNKDRGDRTDIEREAFIQPEPIVCKSKDGLQNVRLSCLSIFNPLNQDNRVFKMLTFLILNQTLRCDHSLESISMRVTS